MTTRPTVRFLDRATPPHIFTLIVITGLGALSMNVFLPSLPSMAAYFDAEYRTVQLSVSVYLAMNAVMQIFLGPISDRYGRRPVLLASIAIFAAATVGCIFAPTIEIFLGFRMAQAAIASGLVLSRAVVRDMVPQNEAASMIGYVTMGMAIVPMIGPVIGGNLGEAFGWQANFVLLFVLGLAVLWLTWADLGETAQGRSTSFRDQFSDYPELLTARRFWGYTLAAAFASGAFFAYLGGAPYVASNVFGLTESQFGLFFGAPALGYALGNGLSGKFSVRLGINRMILWGSLLSTVGLILSLLVSLGSGDSPLGFFGFMVFVGLGNGMVLPNAMSGMVSVRPQLAGTASGLGGAIMIGGGAALSAAAGFLLTLGTGALPLTVVMLVSSTLGVVAIVYTMNRAAQVVAT
ncbi:Bcr/CflA family efflux MFS transporter [Rhodobacterales bacterium HKCCE3408]|nr:Bcr/CflA family efflux MFS transporter [Rhodobacterales bacterium HKCCE3408]